MQWFLLKLGKKWQINKYKKSKEKQCITEAIIAYKTRVKGNGKEEEAETKKQG